jgi:hypothetical protein
VRQPRRPKSQYLKIKATPSHLARRPGSWRWPTLAVRDYRDAAANSEVPADKINSI